MDWSKKVRPTVVREVVDEIQTKCGCIELKGRVRHLYKDDGYLYNSVEMTAPFAGEEYPIFGSDGYRAEEVLKQIYLRVLRERRHEKHILQNRTKIAELLPMWFAFDALTSYIDSTEKSAIRYYVRQNRRGAIDAKELNKYLAPIRKNMKCFRKSVRRDHAKELNRTLRSGGLQRLEFNYGDAHRLFGEDIWTQTLERNRKRVDDVATVDKILLRLLYDFANLYNMCLTDVQVGDTIETIGFGRVMLAVALYRNNEVVAVGAIDDPRGRKALRELVSNKQLTETLPKRVYQAVTRHETFYVRGALAYRKRCQNIIITA